MDVLFGYFLEFVFGFPGAAIFKIKHRDYSLKQLYDEKPTHCYFTGMVFWGLLIYAFI